MGCWYCVGGMLTCLAATLSFNFLSWWYNLNKKFGNIFFHSVKNVFRSIWFWQSCFWVSLNEGIFVVGVIQPNLPVAPASHDRCLPNFLSSSQFMDLRKQKRAAQDFGILNPCGDKKSSSRLPVWDCRSMPIMDIWGINHLEYVFPSSDVK